MNFNRVKTFFSVLIVGAIIISLSSCGEDDGVSISEETGMEVTFDLGSVTSGANVGSATFAELEDGSTKVTVMISGATGDHPMHIHDNTATEGGGIAITLNEVDASGMSETIVKAKDDGTSISYSQLMEYDGYINVHQSATDLATLLAQGDIGVNALTGTSMSVDLGEVDVMGVSGTATFSQRVSGETLVVLALDNTTDGDSHPSHIHFNSAAEGGDIAVSLTAVDGTSGISKTNVSAQDDGTTLTYEQLVAFDGYINVHNSAEDLGTLVAQGDIGVNILTGMSMEYSLTEKDIAGVSGTATLHERVSGEALLVMSLDNTTDGASHPSHIHMNSAVESGGILVTLTSIDGTSGMSKTHISALNDGTMITYDELLEIDGYINVHNSAEDLGTLVAQGDIGVNVLTGMSVTYTLNEVDITGVSGTATIHERVSGEALLIINLAGTVAGATHPSHIHKNSAAVGGGIEITLSSVDGTSGMSATHIAQKNDGTAITYSELTEFDGYINVHNSANDLGTLVAQGNIGINAGG